MPGCQESTLNLHIVELYDEFDNLIIRSDKAFVTALPPPCNNHATVSKY